MTVYHTRNQNFDSNELELDDFLISILNETKTSSWVSFLERLAFLPQKEINDRDWNRIGCLLLLSRSKARLNESLLNELAVCVEQESLRSLFLKSLASLFGK